MIESYFEKFEKTVQYFKSIIKSYSIEKKVYNEKQGLLKGAIVFTDESQFCFVEVKDMEKSTKNKYRYHYMGKDNRLIFRYDNAAHHRELKSFPHHKHTEVNVVDSAEPVLLEVLFEIAGFIKQR